MISKDFDLTDGSVGSGYVTKKPRAEVVTAADLLPTVLGKIEDREPPVRWLFDDRPWGRYWFAPGKVIVVGGPTGGAKTALATFSVFGALQRNPALRVTVANVEDAVDDLLLRGIASQLKLPIDQLRDREGDQLTPAALDAARQLLSSIGPRLQFVRRPFTVERAIASAKDFKSDVAVFDYLQDLRLEDRDGDAQDNVRRIMPQLRALADTGPCVVVTAALSREGLKHIRQRSGSQDFHELDTAIYRDASQIEHCMDEGFCLIPKRGAVVAKVPGQPYVPIPTELYHVKTRASQREHGQLVFDGEHQRFLLAEQGTAKPAPASTSPQPKPGTRGASSGKTGAGATKKGANDGHWL